MNPAKHSSRAVLLGSGLALASSVAQAHASIPGANHFYSGALHPLLAPAHLMAVLALGLLIGQRGEPGLRWAMPGFAIGLAAGLLLTGPAGEPDTDRSLLAGALALGLAVAMALRVPAQLLAVAAGALGLALGLGSGPEGLTGNARAVTLLGTALGAPLLLVYPALMVKSFDKPWLQIGARVIGSWISAAALLVLALALRP